MGTSKSEIFNPAQNRLAQLAKALGHPARIAILEHLFATESCICGDLVEEIGLAQPTISQHLKELKNAGIIQGNVEGTKVCYCINPKGWEEVKEFMGELLNKRPCNSDACC
jgi:ArsR family transcriptional regulator, arsenate/arsenite/antimonite-responsive transcriptional repressor